MAYCDDGPVGAAHLIPVKPLRELGNRLSAHVVFHVTPAARAEKPYNCAATQVLLFPGVLRATRTSTLQFKRASTTKASRIMLISVEAQSSSVAVRNR